MILLLLICRLLPRPRPSAQGLSPLWECACDLAEAEPTPEHRLAEERLWLALVRAEAAA